MSASERLREIWAYATRDGAEGPDNDRAEDAVLALPLIADVVEAAEQIVGSREAESPWGHDVLAALTALSNALEEK